MQPRPSSKGPIIAIIIIVLALAGLAVYALDARQNQTPSTSNVTSNTDGTTDAEDQAAPTPSERVAITYTNNGFEPSELTVKKGTIITITNTSSQDVQFSSDDHPAHQKNSEMNLKVLSPGESTSYTPQKVGEWGFHDHLNDTKTGTITVTE